MTEVKDVFFLQEIFFNFKYCSTDFFKNPDVVEDTGSFNSEFGTD